MHSEKTHVQFTQKPESEQQNYQTLLSEKVPVVQPLRLHQKVVDRCKVRDADD